MKIFIEACFLAMLGTGFVLQSENLVRNHKNQPVNEAFAECLQKLVTDSMVVDSILYFNLLKSNFFTEAISEPCEYASLLAYRIKLEDETFSEAVSSYSFEMFKKYPAKQAKVRTHIRSLHPALQVQYQKLLIEMMCLELVEYKEGAFRREFPHFSDSAGISAFRQCQADFNAAE